MREHHSTEARAIESRIALSSFFRIAIVGPRPVGGFVFNCQRCQTLLIVFCWRRLQCCRGRVLKRPLRFRTSPGLAVQVGRLVASRHGPVLAGSGFVTRPDFTAEQTATCARAVRFRGRPAASFGTKCLPATETGPFRTPSVFPKPTRSSDFQLLTSGKLIALSHQVEHISMSGQADVGQACPVHP